MKAQPEKERATTDRLLVKRLFIKKEEVYAA